MIKNKKDYLRYIKQDALASRRKKTSAHLLGDEVWKFQLLLRKLEYCCSWKKIKRMFLFPYIACIKLRFHNMSVKLGFSIPVNVFEEGLSIAHYGNIVVNSRAKIGKNCRIQEGTNIGTTNGSDEAPIIGNNVFIGTGAKIIGNISIADNVCIGAGAVVVKSIEEQGTTWGGVPARLISNNSSRSNLSQELNLDE